MLVDCQLNVNLIIEKIHLNLDIAKKMVILIKNFNWSIRVP